MTSLEGAIKKEAAPKPKHSERLFHTNYTTTFTLFSPTPENKQRACQLRKGVVRPRFAVPSKALVRTQSKALRADRSVLDYVPLWLGGIFDFVRRGPCVNFTLH